MLAGGVPAWVQNSSRLGPRQVSGTDRFELARRPVLAPYLADNTADEQKSEIQLLSDGLKEIGPHCELCRKRLGAVVRRARLHQRTGLARGPSLPLL